VVYILINFMMVIISKCIYIVKHQVIHLK
jgi:hypothetical protein